MHHYQPCVHLNGCVLIDFALNQWPELLFPPPHCLTPWLCGMIKAWQMEWHELTPGQYHWLCPCILEWTPLPGLLLYLDLHVPQIWISQREGEKNTHIIWLCANYTHIDHEGKQGRIYIFFTLLVGQCKHTPHPLYLCGYCKCVPCSPYMAVCIVM